MALLTFEFNSLQFLPGACLHENKIASRDSMSIFNDRRDAIQRNDQARWMMRMRKSVRMLKRTIHDVNLLKLRHISVTALINSKYSVSINSWVLFNEDFANGC